MDFLDPKKRRSHAIKLILGYVLTGVALLLATTILVFRTYGFDLNRKTGTVIQNGLIFIDAHPGTANILLNGKSKGQTGARLVVPSDQYTVELQKTGYRSWQRTFTLDGGSIERLVYPVLFPENLEQKDVQLYATTPTFASQSPDRRWILIQQPTVFNAFDIIDTSGGNDVLTTLTLPADTLTPSNEAQKLELVEWSTDNRHVLLKHTFGTNDEFVMVNREAPATSFNLNKLFGITPSQVKLRDKREDQFYVYQAAAGILQRADLKTKQLTTIQSGVLAFKGHGADEILYVVKAGAGTNKTMLKWLDGDNDYTVREMPTDTNYLLDIARYDGHWYIAAGSVKEKKAYVYKDPLNVLKTKTPGIPVPVSILKLDTEPSTLSFSATAQFIGLHGSSKFSVYDVEADRQYNYDTKLTIPADQKVDWMDGNRYVTVADGKAVVFDFDGINQQTLSPAKPGLPIFFDRDYTLLYSVSPSVIVSDKPSLARTILEINP